MVPHPPYSIFPIVNCGVDWLTVTSNYRGAGNPLEMWGSALLEQEKATAGQVTVAKRLGYAGLSASGLFLGRRPDGVMMQLSGPRCSPLATQAINLSTSVSRIDLQVTIWTEGEQPHLARWTRDRMLELPRAVGRQSRFVLTEGFPDGETLNVGRRASAFYARLYDKTAEVGSAVPRLLWRYEVELKQSIARQLAVQIAAQQCCPKHVCTLVHAYYTKKGVRPSFTPPSNEHAFQLDIAGASRDVLTWYRESLSKSIQTSILRFGQPAVLEALGLSKLIERGNDNGTARADEATLEAHS